ncbi:MAG: DUF2284 domain-containing protein [Clostridia bacterium]|nr:DUF2284 domain-containing protein [Clostridia bacterium]
MNGLFESLSERALSLGAYKAAVIPVSEVTLDASFRDMCKANLCGAYGRNWTCPPHVGEIDELMELIRSYGYVLVYQTVSELEDSFDIEGMEAASVRHAELGFALRNELSDQPLLRPLHLSAGGCRLCHVCAKADDLPCRFPERAMASLEAHGINVSELAKASGMKYINGQNTVTYFGGVFFDL